MKHKEIIIRFYEYLYSKFTLNPGFEFKINKRDQKTLDNFLLLLQKKNINLESIGEDFWYKYLCFQFEYWRTKDTFLGKNNLMFIWVIGEKAWERWVKKDDNNYWFFVENNFIKFFNIRKKDLIVEIRKYGFSFNEEIKKHKNLGFCILYSDLYEENNNNCQNCKNVSDCKKIMNGKVQTLRL